MTTQLQAHKQGGPSIPKKRSFVRGAYEKAVIADGLYLESR
jgi:hypothetical protein